MPIVGDEMQATVLILPLSGVLVFGIGIALGLFAGYLIGKARP